MTPKQVGSSSGNVRWNQFIALFLIKLFKRQGMTAYFEVCIQIDG